MKYKVGDHVLTYFDGEADVEGIINKVDNSDIPYRVTIGDSETNWRQEDSLKPIPESSTIKDTNPKDSAGIKKAPLWFIPSGPLFELGLAFMEGARKYGAWNWREAGVRLSVYFDAIDRHLKAFKEGEDIDSASGIHHLMKAAACIFVMRDSMLMGNHTDDRPIQYPNGLKLEELNKQAEELITKYPECAKPFTKITHAEKNNSDNTC